MDKMKKDIDTILKNSADEEILDFYCRADFGRISLLCF